MIEFLAPVKLSLNILQILSLIGDGSIDHVFQCEVRSVPFMFLLSNPSWLRERSRHRLSLLTCILSRR